MCTGACVCAVEDSLRPSAEVCVQACVDERGPGCVGTYRAPGVQRERGHLVRDSCPQRSCVPGDGRGRPRSARCAHQDASLAAYLALEHVCLCPRKPAQGSRTCRSPQPVGPSSPPTGCLPPCPHLLLQQHRWAGHRAAQVRARQQGRGLTLPGPCRKQPRPGQVCGWAPLPCPCWGQPRLAGQRGRWAEQHRCNEATALAKSGRAAGHQAPAPLRPVGQGP